jgi:ribonuclease T2
MAAALVVLALGSLASANLIGDLLKLPNTYPDLTACAKTPSFYSCENTTAVQNTCCSPTPGGLVLLTQFWSTYTGLEKKVFTSLALC